MRGLPKCLAIIALLLMSVTQHAYGRTLSIGVVGGDVQADDTEALINAFFEQEIASLFAGEYEIEFIHYRVPPRASAGDINAMLDDAYADPQIDHVLVLDFAANQLLGYRDHFAKPTFLPIVLNAQLLGYPMADGTSGQHNLHYITHNIDLAVELNVLRSVATFHHAALLVDAAMQSKIRDTMQQGLVAQARAVGLEVSIVPVTSDPVAMLAALPPSIDAILYAVYPSADAQQTQGLIDAVNAHGLPSFSLASEQHVRMGALATNSPDTDWTKLARHVAIAIQDVVLGTPLHSLPVLFESDSRLLINMATSRHIQISPSFDVLSEAVLLHEDVAPAPITHSLTSVAREAVTANLQVTMQALRHRQAQAQLRVAMGNRYPRVTATLDHQQRRKTTQTRSGLLPENTTDAGVAVTLPLLSDKLAAAVTIAGLTIETADSVKAQLRLDIIQQAVFAYLEVLRAQTAVEQKRYNLRITQENYRLAKTRVDVGDSSKSDLYRWESELANAKQALLEVRAILEGHRHQLNNLLNRPLDEDFETSVETLDNPALLISDDRIVDLINNEYALDKLTAFLVDLGTGRAAAIKQAQTQIQISQREALREQRARYQPDVNLTARYGRNLDETRAGTAKSPESDWTIGVEMSLPLYDGGVRSAQLAHSELAVSAAMTHLQDVRRSVEQQIRSAAEQSYASYRSISLAEQSEQAARRNYDLVAESYAVGQLPITDLLDAQSLLINASEASMNATYRFLIDLMAVQHATGSFDFFLTDSERVQLSAELLARLRAQ